MAARLKIIGKVFTRLTVVTESLERGSGGTVRYWCECECGEWLIVNGGDLKIGHVKSCGCYRRERAGRLTKTHGLEQHSMYDRYMNMIDRCYNPNCFAYKDYGGRGIEVCEHWCGDNGLRSFIEDMSPTYIKGLTLDRRNNDDGYSRFNCRWATKKEQANNRRKRRRK